MSSIRLPSPPSERQHDLNASVAAAGIDSTTITVEPKQPPLKSLHAADLSPDAVLQDPDASKWLKDSLTSALTLDRDHAAKEAALLDSLLRRIANALIIQVDALQMNPPEVTVEPLELVRLSTTLHAELCSSEEILQDPCCSKWLKHALRTALWRDCLEAANDAETLHAVLAAWAAARPRAGHCQAEALKETDGGDARSTPRKSVAHDTIPAQATVIVQTLP